MRKPILAGNWKMNLNTQEAVFLVEYLKRSLAEEKEVEAVVCPPFTSLYSVAQVLQGTNIKLGAQNMSWEKKGAYTGEVSPLMLLDLGCQYVILGHSERRQYFAETDAMINKKVLSALENGLRPIVCVGETLEEKEANQTQAVISQQVTKSLANLPQEKVTDLVVAYEPIWAIGTGKSASSQEANEVIKYIRSILGEMFGSDKAESIRIQYGGSVKPDNIRELMSQSDIDGALVGGASLEAASFTKLVRYKENENGEKA